MTITNGDYVLNQINDKNLDAITKVKRKGFCMWDEINPDKSTEVPCGYFECQVISIYIPNYCEFGNYLERHNFNQTLSVSVKELAEKVDNLSKENKKLSQENEKLSKENENITKENAKLKTQVQALNDKIDNINSKIEDIVAEKLAKWLTSTKKE